MAKPSRRVPKRLPPIGPVPPAFSPEMWFNPDRLLDVSQVSDQRNALKKEVGFAPIPPAVYEPMTMRGKKSRRTAKGGKYAR